MGVLEGIPRLSPEMASRKLQVLAFVRLFHAQHGVGPSLSEMAAAIGTNRARVQGAVRKLAREGRIHYQPGVPRGIRPAESHEEALVLLQSEGWVVNPDRFELIQPIGLPLIDLDEAGQMTVTNPSLPQTRARAHDVRRAGDVRHDECGDGERGRGR